MSHLHAMDESKLEAGTQSNSIRGFRRIRRDSIQPRDKPTQSARGDRNPDPPCHSTVDAWVAEANRRSNGPVIVAAAIRIRLAPTHECEPEPSERCPASLRLKSISFGREKRSGS